jgi:hypothetical protein
MLKKTLNLAFLLIIGIGLQASDDPWVAWVGSLIPRAGNSRSSRISLPNLNARRNTRQDQDLEQRRQALYNFLNQSENQIAIQNINRPEIRDLLRGLVQFVFLKIGLAFDEHLGYEVSPYLLPIEALELNYRDAFRTYISNQPGNTPQEQISNALTRLNQEFNKNLGFKENQTNLTNRDQDNITALLYLLHNLDDLLEAISKRSSPSANLFSELADEMRIAVLPPYRLKIRSNV